MSKGLPHITHCRKLMVHESDIRGWIAAHTVYPGDKPRRVTPPQPIRQDEESYLTPDGRIPTRRELQRMMEERAKKGKKRTKQPA